VAFIEESERPPTKVREEMALTIGRSDELKALIARIAAEL